MEWSERVYLFRDGRWRPACPGIHNAEHEECEYIRADAFPDHIDLTFKHMQEQIAKLKTRVVELELTEHCGRIEL